MFLEVWWWLISSQMFLHPHRWFSKVKMTFSGKLDGMSLGQTAGLGAEGFWGSLGEGFWTQKYGLSTLKSMWKVPLSLGKWWETMGFWGTNLLSQKPIQYNVIVSYCIRVWTILSSWLLRDNFQHKNDRLVVLQIPYWTWILHCRGIHWSAALVTYKRSRWKSNLQKSSPLDLNPWSLQLL